MRLHFIDEVIYCEKFSVHSDCLTAPTSAKSSDNKRFREFQRVHIAGYYDASVLMEI